MLIDKQYHFIAGFLIFLIAQLFVSGLWAMVVVIAIGTLKEVWDYVSKKGTPDINDLLFTIYGAMPIFVIKLLLANTNP
jgi:uncharacterized membrane protein